VIIKRRKIAKTSAPAQAPEVRALPLADETKPKAEEKEVEKAPPTPLEEILSLEDISTVEFKARLERRKGDRRRGYRRINERALVARAQEEAQSIRELAAREGYKKGLEEAGEEITRVRASLEEFLSCRAQVYEELSNDILEISLEVAKKILKAEVETNSEVLKNILKSVFDEISVTEQRITVKVSPEEIEFARASLPEVLSNSQIDAKIFIISDEMVEKGSCTVLTGNGVIDANFSTQLVIVQNAFGIYKGGQ
jgi:flagellar assembly protein FliH